MQIVLSVLLLVCFGANANTTVITTLDKGEPFEGMTFHDGALWVGKSRKAFNSNYSLEAYIGDKLAGKVTLPHSASYVYPYAKNAVIVVGTAHKPNLTQYTVVENKQGKLVPSTRAIPMQAWAREWLGTFNGKEYFTDPGGNTETNTLGMPSQTFFAVNRTSAPRYLSTRLRLPLAGVRAGNQFYVLNSEAIGSPFGNLHRLDPTSQKVTPVFAGNRHGFFGIAYAPAKNLIAVTDEDSGELYLVDASAGKELSAFPVAGIPRSVTFLGKCALVAGRDARQLNAIDVSDPKNPAFVGTLDVDLPQQEFMTLDKIAADPASGKIYGRSNFPCNGFSGKCDADWNKVLAFTSFNAQELAATCLR